MSSLDGLDDHEILAQTIGIKPGDHICVLYDYSPAERLPEVIDFLKEGLDGGEQCLYVSDDMPSDQLARWLRSYDIDVSKQEASTALQLRTRNEWRLPGPLDAIKMAAQVQQILEAAFSQGFSGVRFAVEMTWTLDPDLPAEAIREWESTANELLVPGAPAKVMCLYGRRRVPRETLAAGLETHPLVMDDGGLRQNDSFRRESHS